MKPFWTGFYKQAETTRNNREEQATIPLSRTVSVAGPVLSKVTEEDSKMDPPTFNG